MSSFSLNDSSVKKLTHTPLKDLNENSSARRVLNASGKKIVASTLANLSSITIDSPGDGDGDGEGGGLFALLAAPSEKPSAALSTAPRRIVDRERTTASSISSSSSGISASSSTLPTSSAVNVDAILAGASNKRALADNLLQAKIDHLERERVELSLQLHLRDEKDRSRKIKIERLEKSITELTNVKTESDNKYTALCEERDILLQKVTNMEQFMQQGSTSSNSSNGTSSAGEGGTGAGVMSIAATLADSLANPPAYLKEGSTQGLYDKMKAASKELKRMEEESNAMSKERNMALQQLENNNVEMIEIREKAEKDRKAMIVLKEAAAEADGFSKEIDELNRDNSNFSQLLDAANREKESLQNDIVQGRKLVQNIRETQKRLEGELEASSLREQIALGEVQRLVGELDTVQCQLNTQKEDMDDVDAGAAIAAFIAGGGDAQLVALAEDLRSRLRDSEAARRKIHSELQDLKGNVRVLVRVRPFLSNDGDNRDTSITCNKDETSMSVQPVNKAANLFHFDHCFSEKSTQDGVYKEVSELIQSSLDGYRVCIFSYGQTGSGKTWTMSGERNGSQRGIIPRAVQQIIEQAIAMKKQGWTVTVNVSVLELYNEELRDLLIGKNEQGKGSDKMKITHTQGRVHVQGLTSQDIECTNMVISMSQFEQLLEQANRSRATIATCMNDVSSRSHMIFMLEMTGIHADGVTVTRGGLRLVDLAGSERLDRTGTLNDAARLKETVNINKSLSSLADVFINLGQKSQHIPYRNSKLTMLLQDCLSGTGKSLMIVNVSPTQASTNETLCSLRFADQVSQVELGKAQKQMYMQAPVPIKEKESNSSASGSASTGGGGLGKAVSRASAASSSSSIRAKRSSTTAALSATREDVCAADSTVNTSVDTSMDHEASAGVGAGGASKKSRLSGFSYNNRNAATGTASCPNTGAGSSGLWKK